MVRERVWVWRWRVGFMEGERVRDICSFSSSEERLAWEERWEETEGRDVEEVEEMECMGEAGMTVRPLLLKLGVVMAWDATAGSVNTQHTPTR